MWDMISVAKERRADYYREVERARRVSLTRERVTPGRGRRAIGRFLIRTGSAIGEPVIDDVS